MANCSKCKKILWISKQYRLKNGIILCSDCYEDYLFDERKKKLDQLSNRILNRCYKIIDNFIEKYGLNPKDEFLIDLQKLLTKKYSIDTDLKDLIDLIFIMNEKIKEDKRISKFENDLKYHREKNFYCSICKKKISRKVFDYSMDFFEEPLCRKHQDEKKATTFTKKLYYELKKRGVDCEIEKFDGYKHIDISIPKAKMYIEIDGKQHSTNAEQIESDLKRDFYSQKDGYVTKRYTNNQIKNHLEELTEALVKVINKRINEISNSIDEKDNNKFKIISKEIDNL